MAQRKSTYFASFSNSSATTDSSSSSNEEYDDQKGHLKDYESSNFLKPRNAKSKRRNKIRDFFRKRPIAYIIAFVVALSLTIFAIHAIQDFRNGFDQYWTDEIDETAFAHHYVTEEEFKEQQNSDIPMSERIIASGIDGPFQIGCAVPNPSQPRASAAFVMLSRNSELDGVLKSMASMERHFNQWYNYPWVFLNDEEFTDEFKETVKKHTSAEVEFGTIPKKEWDFDESIDQEEFGESIHSQGDRTILYGNLASYHKMCRFYSGFFYKHELVQKRDWYWRVEPDVEFYCDITYDPFIEMEKRRKKYGFTVIIGELYYTVPGLFRETRAFIKKSQLQLRNAWNLFISDSKFTRGGNAADYEGLHDPRDILREIEDNLSIKKFLKLNKKNEKHVSEFNPRLLNKLAEKSKTLPILHEDRMDREDYNLCHFWSNFEIARTDIFNSPLYEAYFEHLDKSGGFYKERWGDAPVHSLAVGMLLDLNEIHYFRDIGYRHANFAHCPRNSEKNQLRYKPSETYFRLNDLDQDKRWLRPDIPQKNGIGCRCRCPDNHKEIENASCLKDWVDKTAQNYKPLQPLDTDYYRIIIDERIDEYLANGGQLGYSNIADSLLNEGLVR